MASSKILLINSLEILFDLILNKNHVCVSYIMPGLSDLTSHECLGIG